MRDWKLYEQYCHEFGEIMGTREVTYTQWLEKQIFDLTENKNDVKQPVSNSAFYKFFNEKINSMDDFAKQHFTAKAYNTAGMIFENMRVHLDNYKKAL